MKSYEAYIFDLDGTLLDTLHDLAASVNHALTTMGMPTRSLEEVRQFVGNGVRLLMQRAVPAGTDEQQTEQALAAFRQHYLHHSMDSTCPYDGILPLLNELKARGKRVGVVSNKFQAATQELCKHYFGSLVDVAIGESEQVRKKPAPDSVLEAMRRLGVTAAQTVYIGDSDVDIMTARNASLPCISVLWGFRDRDFLIAHGATTLVSSPSDIAVTQTLHESHETQTASSCAPVYRLLGESGLVEDEEGNIFSASEVADFEIAEKPASETKLSASFKQSSFVSSLDDKSNPAYWYYHYDPRYCGPSREAYMEKMARQYRNEGNRKEMEEKSAVPTPAKPTEKGTTSSTETARKRADQHQREAERKGLRPDYHRYATASHSCGIVNRHNEVLVSYDEYSVIGYYHNGLARVLKKKTGKFGFVDVQGQEAIPCQWRAAGEFNEYMAGVQDDFKKCGYVDVTGRLAIPCIWDNGWPFQNGLARVQKDGLIGMIDQEGHTIVPCIWKGMGDFSEGLAGVQDAEGKCGYINRAGKMVIPCQWKNVWTFSEGLAIVQDFNKKLGFINRNGELVIPCQWKKAEAFKNGLAKVSAAKGLFGKDKWVYIDKQGKVVEKK